MSVINQHIDKGCPTSDAAASPLDGFNTSGKSAWFHKLSKPSSKTNITVRSKLPRPNYSVMKEADIRKMLSEFQLSKVGSRDRVIERHRQWVTLYNANLDASEHVQKTDMQLRRELAEWDKAFDESQRKVKTMTSEAARVYEEANESQFSDLIKKARETHAKNKAAHQKKGQEGDSSSSSSSPHSKPKSSSSPLS
jgi:E3 ubiquitin-protein ligase RAD18